MFEEVRLVAGLIALAARAAKLERRLEGVSAYVTLGRAVTGAVHDIAHPLGTLMSNLEAARDGANPAECLRDASSAAERARDVVERVRNLVGHIDDVPASVDVQGAVVTALRLVRCQTAGRAEVVAHVERGLAVTARRGEIEQIVVNLVANAAHAVALTPGPHHRILVSGTARGAEVLLEVADTGPGVSPEQISMLFDDGAATTPSGHFASGGLAICRDIVSGLGGALEVASGEVVSSRVGPGLRVTVRLPCARAPARTLSSQAEATERPQVLIVDTDDLVRRAVQRALGSIGIVVAVRSHAEAERLVKCEPFDVVFCEAGPDGAAGIALRQSYLERWPDFGDRFTLVVPDAAATAVLPPGARFLGKPIEPAIVRAMLQTLVRS
jgi:hypothetical protein